jgi:hypothetical protein
VDTVAGPAYLKRGQDGESCLISPGDYYHGVELERDFRFSALRNRVSKPLRFENKVVPRKDASLCRGCFFLMQRS